MFATMIVMNCGFSANAFAAKDCVVVVAVNVAFGYDLDVAFAVADGLMVTLNPKR
jgi:hypothetical protein